jgi:hypothetical protein
MISKYTRSDFLEVLFGAYYQEYRGFILVNRIRRGDDRTSARYYPKVEILAKEHFGPEQNIYFSVCPRERMKPEKKHIRFATALWAKVYVGEEGNKGRPYFATPQEAAKAIRRFPRPPTVIVESGVGAHLYWVFDQPFEIIDVQRFEKVLAHVGGLLKGETQLTVDSMLRLPETINSLVEERYLQCEVKFINPNFRYRIEDLETITAKDMEESLAAPIKTPTVAPPEPSAEEIKEPPAPEQAAADVQAEDSRDYLANFNLEAPTEISEGALPQMAPAAGPANVETMWFDSSDAGPLEEKIDDESLESPSEEELDESEPELDFDAAPPHRPAASWAPRGEDQINAFRRAPEFETPEDQDTDTEEEPFLDTDTDTPEGKDWSKVEGMAGPSLTEGIDLDDSMIDELIDDISMSGVYEPEAGPESPETVPEPEAPSRQESARDTEPESEAIEGEPEDTETPTSPPAKPAEHAHTAKEVAARQRIIPEPGTPFSPTPFSLPALKALARSRAAVKVEPVNGSKPLEGHLVSIDDLSLCVASGGNYHCVPWSNVAQVTAKRSNLGMADTVDETIGIRFQDNLIHVVPAGVRLPASGSQMLQGPERGFLEIYEGLHLLRSERAPLAIEKGGDSQSFRIDLEHMGDSLEVTMEAEDGRWRRRFHLPLSAKDQITVTLTSPPKVARSEAFFVNAIISSAHETKENRSRADESENPAHSMDLRLAAGARIDLELRIDGIEIVEELRGQIWEGKEIVLRFPARAPSSLGPGAVDGAMLVAIDSFPIGGFNFNLRVVDSDTRMNLPAIAMGRPRRFRRIYPCFASQDRKVVQTMLQRMRMAGVDFDESALEQDPRKRWETHLHRSLEVADAILLFWSTNARNDQWLVKECAYAIDIKGQQSVIPVILEGESTEDIPRELSLVHFNEMTSYLK